MYDVAIKQINASFKKLLFDVLLVHFPDSSSDDLSGILVIGSWKHCSGLSLGMYPTQIHYCGNCIFGSNDFQ